MSVRVLEQRLRVLGTGSAVPGARISNDELLEAVERHCGRASRRRARAILSRLGVEGRFLVRDLAKPIERARPGNSNVDLAAAAMSEALASSSLAGEELTYLLGHTASPHTRLPPNIAWVADGLAYPGPFAELRQACTGFANALQLAAPMLRAPDATPVGIVGSETGSLHFDFTPSFVDTEQLVNCVQMSDGAGAIVLGPAAAEDDGGTIEALWFGSLGAGKQPGFWMAGDPVRDQVAGFRHDYEAVAKHGPELFQAGVEVAERVGASIRDVAFVLPHQANGNMAARMADAFDIPAERVVADGRELGNMGSASIWVAFDRLRRSGQLAPGDTVLVLGAEATKYLYGGFVYRH